MISKERIISLIESLSLFVSTNSIYHLLVILSSIYLIIYGIPFLMNEMLKNDRNDF